MFLYLNYQILLIFVKILYLVFLNQFLKYYPYPQIYLNLSKTEPSDLHSYTQFSYMSADGGREGGKGA